MVEIELWSLLKVCDPLRIRVRNEGAMFSQFDQKNMYMRESVSWKFKVWGRGLKENRTGG
jgi:hypothetical protein